MRRKRRVREIITQDWLHKEVVVFDRYLFAVPVRGRVAEVTADDTAVKVIFNSDNPGGPNVEKHNGKFFLKEQCRVMNMVPFMETEEELLGGVRSILDAESLEYFMDSLENLSWGALVGIHNIMFGTVFKTNDVVWGNLQELGRKTKGVFVCSDEDMEQEIKDRLRECSREDLIHIYQDIGCGQVDECRVMWHHHHD